LNYVAIFKPKLRICSRDSPLIQVGPC